MVVTTPSTIMLPPTIQHVTTTSSKRAYTYSHLDLDPLTPKSDTFIRAPKSVSGESLVKFRQQMHSVRPLSWIQVDSATGVVWSPTVVGPGADTLSSIYSGSGTAGGIF